MPAKRSKSELERKSGSKDSQAKKLKAAKGSRSPVPEDVEVKEPVETLPKAIADFNWGFASDSVEKPLLSAIHAVATNRDYEYAVVGGGPIGLCTAMELAKAGKKVVLFERFSFFNWAGSSGDLTRMFRTMYTEDYMADFMVIAMKSWDDLAKEAGEGNLILKTGLLNFGDPNYGAGGPEGTLLGPIDNLKRHNMPYHEFENPNEFSADYPFVNLPETYKGLFAPDNGCINLPLLLRTLYRLCGTYGVKLIQEAQVDRITSLSEKVQIYVNVSGTPIQYTVKKVALTAGAYTNQILEPSFGALLNLDIWEMEWGYYAMNTGPPNAPIFKSMWFQFAKDDDDNPDNSNLFYGFPTLPWGPPNLCRISIDNARRHITDPKDRSLAPSEKDLGRVSKFLEKHIPGAVLHPAMSGTCLQTNLPDNLYALGYMPKADGKEDKRVVVFTAGWAMKAVPLIGQVMSKLLFETLDDDKPLADIVQRFSLNRKFRDEPILTFKHYFPLRSFCSNSSVIQKAPQRTQPFSRAEYARKLCMSAADNVKLLRSSPVLTLAQQDAKCQSLTVGIIGAGMAGLYAAMLLKTLGISSKILEANPDRIGGRVYTYRFGNPENKEAEGYEGNDYVDVGAMRLPRLTIMDRVRGPQHWSLVNFLNANVPPQFQITLEEYNYENEEQTYLYYNGISLLRSEAAAKIQDGNKDPFRFGDSKNQGPGSAVPDQYVVEGNGHWLDIAISPFISAMIKSFNNGFNMLMSVDKVSTRAYLTGFLNTNPPLPCSVVNWMETCDSGTGLYDEAFSETVMDAYDFSGTEGWQRVRGGMDRFVFAMKYFLDQGEQKTEILQGCKVTKISVDAAKNGLSVAGSTFQETFSHVINTASLSVMRQMDMRECDLTFKQKEAIRIMHYDFSEKVCVKFTHRFWQTTAKPLELGGQSSTDTILRTVVYPSYDSPVMIVSYTWAQDASRMAAFTNVERAAAIKQCLQVLGEIHGHDVVMAAYKGEYFVMDWYNDPFTQGAFALYGPGQFTDLFPHLVKPAAQGKLHFAGEATSVHHAWIIGALNSAYRAVWQILEAEGLDLKKKELIEKWCVVDEVDQGKFSSPDPSSSSSSLLKSSLEHAESLAASLGQTSAAPGTFPHAARLSLKSEGRYYQRQHKRM